MKLTPERLLPPRHAAYYLHGEDHDALFEAAEALLAAGEPQATRLRLDVDELARIEEEARNRELFGPSLCYVLVRNAQSANARQSEHLLRLLREKVADRLIVCAPGIAWRKSLHQRMQAAADVAVCEFVPPDADAFGRWLAAEIRRARLNVREDALQWMAGHLCGMRLAARQMIERLRWYDDGRGEELGMDVVGDLLGERAPDTLDDWCHAVAMRRPDAISLASRLLREQRVAEAQMLAWLELRVQQLLLYRWFVANHHRNPAKAARVFGKARHVIAEEARCWRVSELIHAAGKINEAGKRIKGASIEDNAVVIERLTMELVRKGGLADALA